MKSATEYLTLEMPDRMGFRNITPLVEAIVKKSGIREGLCLVNAMHITSVQGGASPEGAGAARARRGSRRSRE